MPGLALRADEYIAGINEADSKIKAEIQGCLDEYAYQVAAMVKSVNPDSDIQYEDVYAELKSDDAMRYYVVEGDIAEFIGLDNFSQKLSEQCGWYIPLYGTGANVYCEYDSEAGAWQEPSVATGRFEYGAGSVGYENAAQLLEKEGVSDIEYFKFVNAPYYRLNFMYAKAMDGGEYMIMLNNKADSVGLRQQKVYRLPEVKAALDKLEKPDKNENIGVVKYIEYDEQKQGGFVYVWPAALAILAAAAAAVVLAVRFTKRKGR